MTRLNLSCVLYLEVIVDDTVLQVFQIKIALSHNFYVGNTSFILFIVFNDGNFKCHKMNTFCNI